LAMFLANDRSDRCALRSVLILSFLARSMHECVSSHAHPIR
jgi:hypothetical protein